MKTLRHPAAAFLIFALLTTLFTTVYNGAMDIYDVEQEQLKDGENIGERLQNLGLIEGIDDISKAIEDLKNTKLSPLSTFDILGSLASVGAGILKVVGGIVTLPISILGIIVPFFQIPGIVTTIIGGLVVLYIGFIILSAYLRSDV
jgi:hypothetical protein